MATAADPGTRALAARAAALLASAGLVVSTFLPWTRSGLAALDLGLLPLGAGRHQPTLALTLVVLAVPPALGALAGTGGLPYAASAGLTALLTVVWLAAAPGAALTAGVGVTLVSVTVLLLAAAVVPTRRAQALPGAPGRPLPPPDSPSGHRLSSGPTGGVLEAWGPSRAACLAEAVQGLVASFADVGGAAGMERFELFVAPAQDEELLVELLRRVVRLVRERGMVPVGGALQDRPQGGLRGALTLAPAAAVRRLGPVPNTISSDGLVAGRDGLAWRARITLTV